jgi:predicted metal-dependent hydrolase
MRQSKAISRKSHPRRELLRIDGRPVDVTVSLNPRATRLIVKVSPSTGEASVVAPSRRALDSAMEFARSGSSWIAHRLAHVPQQIDLEPGARIPIAAKACDSPETARTAPVWVDRGARVIRVSGKSEHAPRRCWIS